MCLTKSGRPANARATLQPSLCVLLYGPRSPLTLAGVDGREAPCFVSRSCAPAAQHDIRAGCPTYLRRFHMKSQALIFVAALSAFLLVGCATPLKPNQVRVTFNSEPPGAMIYDGEKAWGTAPVVLVLTASESAMRVGYADQNNMYAMWPSGAKSRKGVRIHVGQGSRQFAFSRPSDVPGLDKDLAYAAQLRQIKASEQQANAASDAAFWQMYNAMQPKSPTYTDCTTIGSSVSCITR